MKHLILGILMLFIVACDESYVDPKIEPYYNEFMLMKKNHCPQPLVEHGSFLIEFADLKRPTAGKCIRYKKDYRIQIDRAFWKRSDETLRYLVVVHELTHCELGLMTHVPAKFHYMAPDVIYLPKPVIKLQAIQMMGYLCNGFPEEK